MRRLVVIVTFVIGVVSIRAQDMGWSANATESFRIFQSKVLDEYDQLVMEFGLGVIDAAGSITEQQQTLRQVVSANLEIQKP